MNQRSRIPSSEIPQADTLQDVVKTIEAVGRGATTYQRIARFIGKVNRQGRYYRKAAEILGLITNYQNYARLTQLGEEFLNASPESRKQLMASAVLRARIFQRVIPFLELHPNGISRGQLQNFMEEVAEPVGETMMKRRVSSVLSWLEEIGIVQQVYGRYMLNAQNLQQTQVPEFKVDEPLFPTGGSLREYEIVRTRVERTESYIEVLRNQASAERAINAHQNLVNLVAARLRRAGAVPRHNQLIDLAARISGNSFIFEMKSTTPDNAHTQIRSGLSQLYEYRYLQNALNAKLVLVIENPLPTNLAWMESYLEDDRDIKLIWDGDRTLNASDNTRNLLSFLW